MGHHSSILGSSAKRINHQRCVMGDEAAFLANVHIRLRFHKLGVCECSGSFSWLHHDPLFGLSYLPERRLSTLCLYWRSSDSEFS